MKTVRAKLIILSIGLVMAAPGFADRGDRYEYCNDRKSGKIEMRLDRQHYRIKRGIENNRLTYNEARKLKKHFHKICFLKGEYMEDGYLTRSEFNHLTRKLDKNSQLIRKFEHNGIDRYIAYHDKYSKQRKNMQY